MKPAQMHKSLSAVCYEIDELFVKSMTVGGGIHQHAQRNTMSVGALRAKLANISDRATILAKSGALSGAQGSLIDGLIARVGARLQ
jgi:hypothetical protein